MSGAASAAPGDWIPPFERTVDLANWNRYAAVNDEFVPIHMDDAAGRAAGQPGAIGMGNLGVAYLHCMLRAWVAGGPSDRLMDGRIDAVAVQFRGPSVRGSVNRACGRVTAVSEGGLGRTLEAEVWIEDGDGVRLTVGTARVSVALPGVG